METERASRRVSKVHGKSLTSTSVESSQHPIHFKHNRNRFPGVCEVLQQPRAHGESSNYGINKRKSLLSERNLHVWKMRCTNQPIIRRWRMQLQRGKESRCFFLAAAVCVWVFHYCSSCFTLSRSCKCEQRNFSRPAVLLCSCHTIDQTDILIGWRAQTYGWIYCVCVCVWKHVQLLWIMRDWLIVCPAPSEIHRRRSIFRFNQSPWCLIAFAFTYLIIATFPVTLCKSGNCSLVTPEVMGLSVAALSESILIEQS